MGVQLHEEHGKDLEVRPLPDTDLEQVSGGGQHGGPVCPVCHSTNVVFDKIRHVVVKCNSCGYTA